MATAKKIAPYGTWDSPIGADLITQKSISIAEVLVDPKTSTVYHVEARPSEAGRNVIVHSARDEDAIGAGWNARSAVQEYGGAAAIVHEGIIYFSEWSSKRIHRLVPGGEPTPVTPQNENHRFADFAVHPRRPELLVAVLEDHTNPVPSAVVTSLVLVNTSSSTVTPLASGADFYSSPAFSPDGTRLAWIQWWHPDMPWEGSELKLADFDATSGKLSSEKHIAGEKETTSVSQPKWASDATLIFLSDVSGFYNPWRYDVAPATGTGTAARAVLPSPLPEDFAEPAWLLGASRYAVLSPTSILASSTRNGLATLLLIDVNSGSTTELKSPFVNISAVRSLGGNKVVFVGVKEDDAPALVQLDVSSPTSPAFEVVKATSKLGSTLPKGIISQSQPFALSLPQSNDSLHVLYYAPCNPDYAPNSNEKPPCVVNVHGGPTARVPPGLHATTQYYTSRGWGWLDVNYGGSSGYGRTYRERLRGNWGIVDVEDCVSAVEQLGERGLIDPKRVAIRGGSAGGFTALAAVVTKPSVFTAATSSYGISDLFRLAADTHKFESRYLEKLIGGTAEEVPDVYKARSPVLHADNITAPLLILQGSADAVVPPSQAELIVEKIKARGGRVEYVLFDGEGHGWRRAENVKTALEKELEFYTDVFGLKV